MCTQEREQLKAMINGLLNRINVTDDLMEIKSSQTMLSHEVNEYVSLNEKRVIKSLQEGEQK